MILNFKQQINGKPTHFPEKIMASMPGDMWNYLLEYSKYRYEENHETWPNYSILSDLHDHFRELWTYHKINPKIHTIRKDPNNRWEAGKDIHFYINNRTRFRLQFAPVLKCVSVQDIVIFPDNMTVFVYRPDNPNNEPRFARLRPAKGVFLYEILNRPELSDSKGGLFELSTNEIYNLAINDGFNSPTDFFNYFNEDFAGKIIHWTDKRY